MSQTINTTLLNPYLSMVRKKQCYWGCRRNPRNPHRNCNGKIQLLVEAPVYYGDYLTWLPTWPITSTHWYLAKYVASVATKPGRTYPEKEIICRWILSHFLLVWSVFGRINFSKDWFLTRWLLNTDLSTTRYLFKYNDLYCFSPSRLSDG